MLIKFLFFIYHSLTQSSVRTCRFTPTCSQYAQKAIEKYGLVKGCWLALKRLASCHPFTNRPFYDPA